MKRETYFNMLLFYLGQLPQEEAFKVATFFSDMVDEKMEDGMSEDAALESLGDPKRIASQVLLEAYGITPSLGEYVAAAEPSIMSEPVLGFDMMNASSNKNYTVEVKDVKQIIIDAKNIDIDVNLSSDEKIHVRYVESNTATYSVTRDDNILKVFCVSNSSDGFPLKGILSINKKKDPTPNVILEIPAKYSDGIELNCENASTRVIGLVAPDSIMCNCKNGTVRIIDTNATVLYAKTSNYRVTVTNVNVVKDVNVSTSSASIDLNKVLAESILCKTNKSEISIKDATVKNMLQASTSDGYIDFKEVSGNYIDLRTTNGRISGTIVGNINDYSINSKTTGGKSNLPNIPFGVKRLSAVTTKENIHITFQDPK
ncbi:MAG: DUF4097 family beta strand repeat-containing protein [Clostridia bacterium]|nr:DUF4097 family beta strand repeat-containing protein [Clostridia bacterium]